MGDDINNKLVNYLIHKSKDQVIDKFEDYFSFLNNDEPSWIFYEGLLYPSVSVAFQGARASDQETKEKISMVDSPDELIELAQGVEDPEDWESRRLKVMEILIRDKFRRSLEMRERLKLTEEKQIVARYEEESPSNLFWGIVGKKGQNQIGRILERVRADIQDNSDLKKWLLMKFPLQNDKILLPTITLNVSKDGQLIETVTLRDRSYYYMGQYKTNSVLLAHPSISRLHACLICEENNKVRLVDMESKSGSFVNGEILEKLQDRELQNGDMLTFALSTRSYEIVIDYTEAKKELQKRNIQLQQQVKQLQRLNQPSLTPEELRRIMGFSIDDTLFVSGLPDNANIFDIKNLFSEHAKVKDVKLPVDKWSGKQRGFAYVIFETKEEFSKAFLHSMNLKYGEHKLKVKVADKEKSSQLMSICRINDENDSKKRRGNDRFSRNDNYKSKENSRRDNYDRRRSSRSRSRSYERKNRNRDERDDKKQQSNRQEKGEDKNRKNEDRNIKNEEKNIKNEDRNSKNEDTKDKQSQKQKYDEKEKDDKQKKRDKSSSKTKETRRRSREKEQKNDRSRKDREERSRSRHKESRKDRSAERKRSPKSSKNDSKRSRSRSKNGKEEQKKNRNYERSKKSNSVDRKERRRSKSKEKQDKKEQNVSQQSKVSNDKKDKHENEKKVTEKASTKQDTQNKNDKNKEEQSKKDNKSDKTQQKQNIKKRSSSSSQSSNSSSSNSNSSSNSRSSSSFSISSSQSSK